LFNIIINIKRNITKILKYYYTHQQKGRNFEKIENVNEEWRNACIILSLSIILGLEITSDTLEDVITFIDRTSRKRNNNAEK
jgi:hypothetical protein